MFVVDPSTPTGAIIIGGLFLALSFGSAALAARARDKRIQAGKQRPGPAPLRVRVMLVIGLAAIWGVIMLWPPMSAGRTALYVGVVVPIAAVLVTTELRNRRRNRDKHHG